MQRERLTITEPEVARVLVENKSARLLEPFMKRECSLGEAAKELGIKMPALLYHVSKFVSLNLLEVAHLEKRKGRPIKRYQSTAKAFFVPFHVTPSETLERLLGELTAYEAERFHRGIAHTLQNISLTWGLHISSTAEYGLDFSLTPDAGGNAQPFLDVIFGPDAPAIISTEGKLNLDFETAKAFQKELLALTKRYSQKQRPNAQPYAYRLGLTPLYDDLSYKKPSR